MHLDCVRLHGHYIGDPQVYRDKDEARKLAETRDPITLLRTKNPDIDVQVTGRTKEDYERLFHIAKETLKGIRAGVFIPNRGCWMCSSCEFDPDCREWTGNEEVMTNTAS